MKTRQLLTLLLACLTFASAYANNNDDDVKKQINRIKKSSAYLYAIATDSTEAGAYNLAEELLYNEIHAWAAKKKSMQGVKNFVVNNKKTLWTNLSLTRGNMVQSFVYVKKSDIVPVENSEVISAATATTLQSTVEPLEDKEVKKVSKKSLAKYPEFITELSQCTEYSDFVTKLRQMKTDGRIKSYDRYSKLTNANACYIAIYNTAGKMVAILSPGDTRQNVATSEDDGVDNYHGCGAIGFTIE